MGELLQTSDRPLIECLRRNRSGSVAEMSEWLEVTPTAIRQRLSRLMEQGIVAREVQKQGRGRPIHRYHLTTDGERTAGDNYADLAVTLWNEIRAISDPTVRRGLLQRITTRLAGVYRDQVRGESVRERMDSVADLMARRDVPFESSTHQGLPVLTAMACPYPDLAEQDRSICAMERMLLADLTGYGLKLTECRLDGGNCCRFEAGSVAEG